MGFAIYGEEIGDFSGNPEFDAARAILGKMETPNTGVKFNGSTGATSVRAAYLGSEDIKPANFSESFHIRISRLCHIDR